MAGAVVDGDWMQVCSLVWNEEYREMASSHGYPDNQIVLWKYPAMTRYTVQRLPNRVPFDKLFISGWSGLPVCNVILILTFLILLLVVYFFSHIEILHQG